MNRFAPAIALLVAACGPSGGGPSSSSPLALSPDGLNLWVVNPDADSVTRVDLARLEADPPIPVGREPWSVAVAPSGTVLVVNRADGTLSFLDPGRRFDLPLGPEPGGVAVSGDSAYVTVSGADEIAVVDVSARRVAERVPVGRLPWAIAVADDETVIATHRQARLRPGGAEVSDDGKEGWLTFLGPSGRREAVIAPHDFGHANGLEGVAVHGETVFVAHLLNAPALPRDFEHTVSGALTSISSTGADTLHVNDSDFSTPVNFPRAVAVSPDGARAYLVLAGTDAVMGIDLDRRKLLGFWQVGRNPRGIVLDRDGSRAYVMNYLSRDVSVLDLVGDRRELRRIPVAPETLPPSLLRGKMLFNNANDPRLSHLGWISCATCHFDGGVDGTTWLTPDGPRQTQPLWRLAGTAPFHASATRDEVQDFEVDIEQLMDGIGLAPGAAGRELGEPSAGSAEDLDALAAFVLDGIRVPAAPRSGETAVAAGREVFLRAGCAGCHAGPQLTDSRLPGPPGTLAPDGASQVVSVLRDVGTLGPADVLGADGFDVPTLLGLHATAPYLHDGSADTLDRVLDNPLHLTITLTATERSDLVAFLDSL